MIAFKIIYFSNSLGVRGGFDNSGLVSPAPEKTSLIAPMLDSNVDVSIGINTTFEFWLRVMSRKDSMYRDVIRY